MRYVALLMFAFLIPACGSSHNGTSNSGPAIDPPLEAFLNLTTGQPVTVEVINHGFPSGSQIEIDGLFGTYNDSTGHPGLQFASYNGLWTITNVTQNTFDLVGSSWAGQNIGGYSWYPDTPTVTLK